MHLLQNIKKRRKAVLVVTLSILSGAIILNLDLSPDFYYVYWNSLENISCHYMEHEDVLPSADHREFAATSIFFHETSCKGSLDSRQSCAVESAARAHPEWDINVLFTAPGTQKTLERSSALLQKFENVNFFRIHVKRYAKGTPLEDFVARGAMNRTRWRISHASDVLRYLSLFKWGGVYLDLDVVVAKPLTSLVKNWAAREGDFAVAAGAMAFSRDSVGRSVAAAAISDIKRNYRGDIWGHNGPGVITRVLKQMCSTGDATKMSAAACNGFEVYSPELFYPIEWRRAETYFLPGRLVADAYVYHVWNHFTQHRRVAKGSPYDALARKDFRINYKPKVWGNNGPGVITRVLKTMCKGQGKKWNRGCDGFIVYEPALFYPVYYKKHRLYFKVGATLPNEKRTFVHHLWNAFTRTYKIPKDSPYDRLAKEHCPSIYQLYGDHFGI